jgi:small subunit ribosomal protein S21
MLIVEVKNNDSIDRALKVLKSKVIKTKQQQQLTDKKEYTKKSVRNRSKLLKAIYTERKRKG